MDRLIDLSMKTQQDYNVKVGPNVNEELQPDEQDALRVFSVQQLAETRKCYIP